MKIAISGKGGVGKSTLSAALAMLLSGKGGRVLALDADPAANLAAALGIPGQIQKKIIPISQQIELIEERTGAKVKQYGQMFRINPDVSDVAGKYAINYNGVNLLVLGAVTRGGGGCACPESVFIKALVSDLVLYQNDVLIMDMEAGVEHLGRATAGGVDMMIIVVEPGQRSLDCAKKIHTMANQIGIKNIGYVGNKITGKNDEEFILTNLKGPVYLGSINYSEQMRTCDRTGRSVLESADAILKKQFTGILDAIELNNHSFKKV